MLVQGKLETSSNARMAVWMPGALPEEVVGLLLALRSKERNLGCRFVGCPHANLVSMSAGGALQW